ncbi:MAG TPA: hypothetical protein VHG91_14100, partial [Longimicrobium sp.]|nr:hypothetical protein [Longimicrobium sp.]
MTLIDLTGWLWPLGLLGFAAAAVLYTRFRRLSPGNEVMRGLAAQVEAGSGAFLKRELPVLGVFVLVLAALLFLGVGMR